MATQRIQVKDNDFESPYTDNEVARVFRQLVENGQINSNFGRDLYNGARRFGSYTTRQIPWLHVLVAQAEGRPTKPQPQVQNQGGYASIHADNYGHDYPSTAEIREFVQIHPEILEGASDREKWEPVPAN